MEGAVPLRGNYCPGSLSLIGCEVVAVLVLSRTAEGASNRECDQRVLKFDKAQRVSDLCAQRGAGEGASRV
eukprot:169000-Pyramimonas_sp.AAC.1